MLVERHEKSLFRMQWERSHASFVVEMNLTLPGQTCKYHATTSNLLSLSCYSHSEELLRTIMLATLQVIGRNPLLFFYFGLIWFRFFLFGLLAGSFWLTPK